MPRPVTIAAAVAALLALTGCAGAAAPAPSEPAPAPTTAPSASAPASSPTGSSSLEPARPISIDDWLEYATSDGSVSFRYPPTWTLEADSEPFSPDGSTDTHAPPERWADSATLTAPNGQQLLAMHDFVDIGGACGGVTFPLEALATEPAQGEPLLADDGEPVIATVALGTDDDRWRVGMGITSSGALEVADTCVVYFVGSSSDGGVSFGTHFQLSSGGDDPLWTVDSLDDARAYMETDEYATIIEILRSFETR